MPTTPKRPCRYPGCPNLCSKGVYCDEHRKRYNEAMERQQELVQERDKRKRRSRELKAFITALSKQPQLLTAWDERLWITLLDTATVNFDGTITFSFKGGHEIRI